MEIFQIAGICIIATITILVLKEHRPEIAVQVSIVTGVIILLMVSGQISSVINLLATLSAKMDVDIAFISIILKVIGIAYIAEFSAEICKDAGQSAIASKIELASKIFIVILAIPIITSLMDLIISLMP